MTDLLRRAFHTDAPNEEPQACWAMHGNNSCLEEVQPDWPVYYGPVMRPRKATTRIGLCDEHYEEIVGGGVNVPHA